MTAQQLLKTAPVTALLLISFVGLFAFQVYSGVDANEPTTEALLHWGANALPFTMSGEPWRLVTSAFLHIGLMHLLFNSFAIYFFGQVAEPILGSAKFLALFLLSAIGGNLLNSQVTWNAILESGAQPGISAGASGGIMGIGAALLIIALFKISVNGLRLNLKSLIIIMAINLVYGFAVPGIDNAGHIGGAITGIIIAAAFALAYKFDPPAPSAYFDPVTKITYHHTPTDTATSKVSPWQFFSWLVIAIIALGLFGWWQSIHQQIIAALTMLTSSPL